MSARLTGSGVGRALLCAPAYSLPAVHEPPSDDAVRGTAVHEFVAMIAQGVSRDAALALTTEPKARELCAWINCDDIPRGRAEVRFAYAPETGEARLLPGSGHRDYSAAREDEIPGTADLLVTDAEDGIPTVDDWKSGGDRWADEGRGDLVAAQLDFYGLALARVLGADAIRWRVVVVADNGAIGIGAERVLEWDALARTAERVRDAWERVQCERSERVRCERDGRAYTPDVTRGPQCRWCPSTGACPAVRNAIATLLISAPPTNPNAIGDAYLAARDAERVAAKMRDIARDHVMANGEARTSDGRIVRLDSRGSLRVSKANR